MGAKPDECFIVVKAQPHRSSRYFETVCCAGIGRDGKWRRQYPVPFRILKDEQKFKRWEWIRYQYIQPSDDPRIESQKVLPETLEVGGQIKPKERTHLLNPLVKHSFREADEDGCSLALLRPQSLRISWDIKSASELADERRKHEELANQLSFLDETAEPLEPCPVQFYAHWTDGDGKSRRHECDDWETSAAFLRFEREYGRERAFQILQEKYEHTYFKAGLALAFSTHKRRNIERGTQNQWLLVGMIRLDRSTQGDFLLNN